MAALALPQEFLDSLNCVQNQMQKAFCKSCECCDICRNKTAMNVIKATFIVVELELISLYRPEALEDKISTYQPTMKTLCQC